MIGWRRHSVWRSSSLAGAPDINLSGALSSARLTLYKAFRANWNLIWKGKFVGNIKHEFFVAYCVKKEIQLSVVAS